MVSAAAPRAAPTYYKANGSLGLGGELVGVSLNHGLSADDDSFNSARKGNGQHGRTKHDV